MEDLLVVRPQVLRSVKKQRAEARSLVVDGPCPTGDGYPKGSAAAELEFHG